jgi:hypothetical protein
MEIGILTKSSDSNVLHLPEVENAPLLPISLRLIVVTRYLDCKRQFSRRNQGLLGRRVLIDLDIVEAFWLDRTCFYRGVLQWTLLNLDDYLLIRRNILPQKSNSWGDSAELMRSIGGARAVRLIGESTVFGVVVIITRISGIGIDWRLFHVSLLLHSISAHLPRISQ